MSTGNISYKELHEQFVSDHVGTTSPEVAAILCASGIAVFSRVCVQTFLWKTTPRFTWYTVAIDHICLVLPLQLVLTLWSDYVFLFLLGILLLLLIPILLQLNSRFKIQWLSWNKIQDKKTDPQLSFINNFRAYLLIYTAISILGVDFVIFPRRFCKAETYGTGFMDIAVGMFVISNAVVSPEARGKYSNPRIRIRCLLNRLVSCLPLLFLGLSRLVLTKGANYHEHVSEYGVHWNFFITLTVLKIMSTLFYIYVPEFLWSLCALAVVVGYQYSLDYGSLKDYILLGEDGQGGRDGIVNANREGIFSCLGYFALYVFGTEIGKMIFSYERWTLSAQRTLLIVMTVMSMFFWVLYSISAVAYGEPVSRRFANLTYVLWILALSTQTMSVLLLVDLTVEYLRISLGMTIEILPAKGLLNAINYNGLFYFLLSNVLTGFMNITMETIHMSALPSFLILTLYMSCLSAISVCLFVRKMKIKFWYTVAIDHICLVLPLQLILTLWRDYVFLSLVCILILSLTGIVFKLNSGCFKTQWLSWNEIRERHIDPQLSFINNVRAYVLVCTAISILGVDFVMFPRRFCKAETYGTGFMDTGVGLFVISNAIVSPEARGKYRNPGIRCLVNCLTSCLPLLFFGVLRFFVTKGANYHEHVSEYGVHWNFFFTLAALKIMSTLFYINVPEFLWSLCALAVVVGYQYSLDYGGLKDYILLGEDGQGGRDGLVNANREGIFSCLGYFALYVFGTEIGKMIFRCERRTMSAWRTLLIVMTVMCMFFWVLYSISALAYGEPVSRRFANITFVLWILALSTQTMCVSLLVDLIVEYLKISSGIAVQTFPTKGLLNAINYNGLFYFLLSNVLTGLVNITMETIHMSALPSFLILTLYMSCLSAISVCLLVRRVRLKFW